VVRPAFTVTYAAPSWYWQDMLKLELLEPELLAQAAVLTARTPAARHAPSLLIMLAASLSLAMESIASGRAAATGSEA